VTAPVSPQIRRLLSSPAWFIPYDDFRRRRGFVAGLTVQLDRWTGSSWVPSGLQPTITPSGVVAYPGLGRRREPWTVQPELYRARFRAPGYRPLYVADDEPFDTAKAYELTRGIGNLCIGRDSDPRYDPRRLVELLLRGLQRPQST